MKNSMYIGTEFYDDYEQLNMATRPVSDFKMSAAVDTSVNLNDTYRVYSRWSTYISIITAVLYISNTNIKGYK